MLGFAYLLSPEESQRIVIRVKQGPARHLLQDMMKPDHLSLIERVTDVTRVLPDKPKGADAIESNQNDHHGPNPSGR